MRPMTDRDFSPFALAYAARLEKLIDRQEKMADRYLEAEKRRRLQARLRRLGRII